MKSATFLVKKAGEKRSTEVTVEAYSCVQAWVAIMSKLSNDLAITKSIKLKTTNM